MQSVSSRIWTRVAVFISYDDNDYTTGTSLKLSHFDETFKQFSLVLVQFCLHAVKNQNSSISNNSV